MISDANFLQVNRAQWVWKEFLFVEAQGSSVEVSWREGEESSALLTCGHGQSYILSSQAQIQLPPVYNEHGEGRMEAGQSSQGAPV